MIQQALRRLLLDSAGVVALVADRIVPWHLGQSVTQPSIVYAQISDDPGHHYLGVSGPAKPRFQFDIRALNYEEIVAIAREVKLALDGFSGIVAFGSASPQETIEIQGIFKRSEFDLPFDDNTRLYRRAIDFMIGYPETIP